jgi:hypothetical protein
MNLSSGSIGVFVYIEKTLGMYGTLYGTELDYLPTFT